MLGSGWCEVAAVGCMGIVVDRRLAAVGRMLVVADHILIVAVDRMQEQGCYMGLTGHIRRYCCYNCTVSRKVSVWMGYVCCLSRLSPFSMRAYALRVDDIVESI